jgi:hypothetical protein
MAAMLPLVLTLVALGSGRGDAFDPSPLQDFCVADNTSKGKETTCFCQSFSSISSN